MSDQKRRDFLGLTATAFAVGTAALIREIDLGSSANVNSPLNEYLFEVDLESIPVDEENEVLANIYVSASDEEKILEGARIEYRERDESDWKTLLEPENTTKGEYVSNEDEIDWHATWGPNETGALY
jgi:hypothetical protein